MNRVIRSILVSSLAVVGVLAAVPSVAHADEREHPRSEARGDQRGEARDRERGERERVQRERNERERNERERERERGERERFARAERERQQHLVCGRAYESGASARRLREMGCYVR